MTKRRTGSPTLQLTITDQQHARAVRSNSGGCLIADAIKEQYPHLSGVIVDMATIRVTDKAKGLRFTYLTPPLAQHVLLSFDQGWTNPTETLTVTRAVKIDKIAASPKRTGEQAKQRESRLAELQEKVELGEELTQSEKMVLTKMTNPKRKPLVVLGEVERPSARGPVTDVITSGNNPATVVGGSPLPQGEPHPNLLRGRNRHFGAKLADPGEAFNEAVAQAVAEHMATQELDPTRPF